MRLHCLPYVLISYARTQLLVHCISTWINNNTRGYIVSIDRYYASIECVLLVSHTIECVLLVSIDAHKRSALYVFISLREFCRALFSPKINARLLSMAPTIWVQTSLGTPRPPSPALFPLPSLALYLSLSLLPPLLSLTHLPPPCLFYSSRLTPSSLSLRPRLLSLFIAPPSICPPLLPPSPSPGILVALPAPGPFPFLRSRVPSSRHIRSALEARVIYAMSFREKKSLFPHPQKGLQQAPQAPQTKRLQINWSYIHAGMRLKNTGLVSKETNTSVKRDLH